MAGNDGTATANGELADDSSKFTVFDLGSSKIGLRSSLGKYLVAESFSTDNKNVNANRDKLGSWEIFEVKYLGGVKVALKAHHGDFVVASSDGSLKADVKDAGTASEFKPECVEEL